MLDNIKTIPQEDFTIGKNLLAMLSSDELSLGEFEKEVAYFALSCGFDELLPKQPPERPKELAEYGLLTSKQRERVSDNFWKQDLVAVYLKQKYGVYYHNRHTKEWLGELLLQFKDDPTNQDKVKARLELFRGLFNEGLFNEQNTVD